MTNELPLIKDLLIAKQILFRRWLTAENIVMSETGAQHYHPVHLEQFDHIMTKGYTVGELCIAEALAEGMITFQEVENLLRVHKPVDVKVRN